MATYETEPTTVEKHEEDGNTATYEKVEAIYIGGGRKPTYLVGTDQVWTGDNYLSIRLDNDGGTHEREIHKIPHERISRRKRVTVKAEESAEIENGDIVTQ